MKYSLKIKPFVFIVTGLIFAAVSCKKDDIAEPATPETATNSTITVAAGSTLRTTDGENDDSIYILHSCPAGMVRDSITESALPSAIGSYLETNYSGYTFGKAYTLKGNTGINSGYIAVIYFNYKPVALAFDSNGNFIKVLEQREKGDLMGNGWHRGGRFEGRGGIIKDTLAINSLPASVISYFSANYASDTILKAYTGKGASYIIVSKNNGLSATLFTADGNFGKRIVLGSKTAIYKVNDQPVLSAVIQSYLDTTYPNYTRKKAYALSLNNVVTAYIVIIDANNTKYALEFNASGVFVRVKTIF